MKLSDIPSPPLHNLLLPHDGRYPFDDRGCPAGCQFQEWAEANDMSARS